MKNQLGIAIVLAHSVGLAPTFAFAQIEEVIVTAEKRESSLQDTDISITVMDATSLQELGVASYADIGDFAPNVMIHEMAGKVGAAVSIRGFRNGETIATFEPKVALYLDGVIIAKNAGSAFDVVDLERVEILRGPQGTLYGRNTVGGAINLVTKKPHFQGIEGRITATLGDYNQQDIFATINLPLTNTLAMKANLASLQRDGYWDNNFLNRDEGDKDRLVGQLQLMWQPNDDLSVLYSYDRTIADETPTPRQLLANNVTIAPELSPYVDDGGNSNRDFEMPSYQQAYIEGHAVTAEWALNEDLSLLSITAFRDVDDESLTDIDSTPEFVFGNSSEDEVNTLTQEFRVIGTALDENLDYTGGLFYMDEDIDVANTTNLLPNAGGLASGVTVSARNKIWAIFGETAYRPNDKWELTAGIRYTEEDREMNRFDSTIAPAIGLNNVVYLDPAQGDFDDVSGTLSVAYHWTYDLMTYLKASKGYVSGGFNARSPSTETFTTGYDEEIVYTYEFGWKSTWFENRLQVNGAIFYNDYTDLQVNLLDQATGRNNLVNAADAIVQGAEIELLATPTENLEVSVSYGYLDSRYKEYVDPVTNEDFSDDDFAYAPKNTVNAYLRYAFPILQDVGELSGRVDWSSTSKHLIGANGFYEDGYDFVNARLTMDNIMGPGDTQFRVALWGKNLTDEVWLTSGFDLLSVFGFQVATISAPRSYGVDLELRF